MRLIRKVDNSPYIPVEGKGQFPTRLAQQIFRLACCVALHRHKQTSQMQVHKGSDGRAGCNPTVQAVFCGWAGYVQTPFVLCVVSFFFNEKTEKQTSCLLSVLKHVRSLQSLHLSVHCLFHVTITVHTTLGSCCVLSFKCCYFGFLFFFKCRMPRRHSLTSATVSSQPAQYSSPKAPVVCRRQVHIKASYWPRHNRPVMETISLSRPQDRWCGRTRSNPPF